MILLDVNVLVYAYRVETPRHAECRQLVDALVNGNTAFGMPEIVLSGFVRIVTLPAWVPPSSPQQALDFCDIVRSSAACRVVQPEGNHWSTFTDLCLRSGARGNLVADAYLAAFAISRGDEWVTADRDFGRFPGLTWRFPWDAHSTTNPR